MKPKKSAVTHELIAVHCAHAEMRDITDVIPNPRNPNKHPEKQIAMLAKIIRGNGWRSPIVISKRSGFVVKGHGRLEAAKLLQVQSVPVDLQDYENEAMEWADVIADNRIAELAEIDNTALKDLLQELDTGAIDMDLTGFDATALEDLMTQFHVGTDDNGAGDFNYQQQFGIIVTCKDAEEQEKNYNALIAAGYNCKVVVT